MKSQKNQEKPKVPNELIEIALLLKKATKELEKKVRK